VSGDRWLLLRGFFTNTLDFTSQRSGDVSGRYDQHRSISATSWKLPNWHHRFSRFNPCGGLSNRILPGLMVYASYGDANCASRLWRS